MKFDATYQGKVYQLANGVVWTLRPDGKFAAAYADYERITQVVLTGYKETGASGNTGYQTRTGGYIFLDDGWEQIGTVAIAQYSQTQAQALVNKIIKNNQQILRCNLLCARYASKLTEEQKSLIRELQSRLQMRNNALQAGGLTTGVTTGYPKEYAELSGYLEALMAGETIGVAVSTIVWIVIAATVVAGLGTAAYYAYKSLADESEADVKYSEELTKILTSKLTEEEYQQLLNETKGLLTKSKIKTLVKTYSKGITIAALAVGGFLLWGYLNNTQS